MNKNKTDLNEYMTVGQLAKKMGVTVRTLQYYDKEKIISPQALSEGGRRLYTSKDVIKLHQVLSLKSLGFSLDDIKNNLTSLDTPNDVFKALSNQERAIKEKIDNLVESLKSIQILKDEVIKMQKVDFNKYADIIVNLQMKNEYYWLIKYFDDKTLDHLRLRFNKDSGMAFMDKFNNIINESINYINDNIAPNSDKGQSLAACFWDLIMEFTEGDMSLLPLLMEFNEKNDEFDKEWKERQELSNTFIEPALGFYFDSLGYNPFEDKKDE